MTATPAQTIALVALVGGSVAVWIAYPQAAATVAHHCLAALFVSVAVLKTSALILSTPLPAAHPEPADEELPAYTVLVPLRDESAMLLSLVAAVARLDYPRDRLQVLLLLEEDDQATRDATSTLSFPEFIGVAIVPPGRPQTKPRACNHGLSLASGEFVTVYDAEDRPHPRQLREAAARFAAGGSDLVCLQAPLRIDAPRGFLRRQFALEYAAQFEVLFPALARLGLPFPLGGTSNHFRTAALRELGGWDPWNVTEDADMGFRIAARGWRLGMLRSPTNEDPPPDLSTWLPQRTRWIKGHMQTLMVHLRRPGTRRWRALPSLAVTVLLGISSAVLHGPLAAVVLGTILLASLGAPAPDTLVLDLSVLSTGWAASSACAWVGARRARLRSGAPELLLSLAYWPLQTLAALHALVQLLSRPHHWDKTPHAPV